MTTVSPLSADGFSFEELDLIQQTEDMFLGDFVMADDGVRIVRAATAMIVRRELSDPGYTESGLDGAELDFLHTMLSFTEMADLQGGRYKITLAALDKAADLVCMALPTADDLPEILRYFSSSGFSSDVIKEVSHGQSDLTAHWNDWFSVAYTALDNAMLSWERDNRVDVKVILSDAPEPSSVPLGEQEDADVEYVASGSPKKSYPCLAFPSPMKMGIGDYAGVFGQYVEISATRGIGFFDSQSRYVKSISALALSNIELAGYGNTNGAAWVKRNLTGKRFATEINGQKVDWFDAEPIFADNYDEGDNE